MGILARNWFKVPPADRVPPGSRIFAIGDIHGRLDLLDQLLEKIENYVQAAPPLANIIIFLGDYVDRGPDSRSVLQRLIDLEQALPGWKLVFLRGNHDQTVLDFLDNPGIYRAWREFGAAQTLLSYGIQPPEDLAGIADVRDRFAFCCPAEHLEFLDRLKLFHVEGDYAFVHAGILPGRSLADQEPEDLLWIRDEFLRHPKKFEKVVVHGHTPSAKPENLENRIGVDTGAHATGCLTALVLEDDRRSFLMTG